MLCAPRGGWCTDTLQGQKRKFARRESKQTVFILITESARYFSRVAFCHPRRTDRARSRRPRESFNGLPTLSATKITVAETMYLAIHNRHFLAFRLARQSHYQIAFGIFP